MSVKDHAIRVLEPLRELSNTIGPALYTQRTDILHGSSIGMHVRHILELYECLIDGADCGIVNYDQRDRKGELETNPQAASQAIERISVRLSGLENQTVILEIDLDPSGGDPYQIPSSILRELTYNIEHALHHMAMIKTGIFHLKPGLPLPENFGIAPSTIRHRERQKKLQ